MTGVGTFTVKATDEGGNLPTNVGDGENDFEVLISVRPSKSILLGTDAGKLKFDAKTGEATFFVQVSDEAEIGDSVTVTVTAIGESGIAPAIVTVMYGEADGTGPGMDGEMTKATGIIASYLAVAKTFGVTWTPAADAEQQYIVLFSLPDYEVPAGGVKVLGPDARSHEFTFEDDVAAGDYEVLVATFIDGTFYYDDDTAVMVTVE